MRNHAWTAMALATAVLLLAGCVSNGTGGGEKERKDGIGIAAPELDKGTFAIVVEELGHSYPTLWAWRPGTAPWDKREYWVMYKPHQPGGYVFPGPDLPEATLEFSWEDVHHGDGSNANAFLDWILVEYAQHHRSLNVVREDLELHTYDRQ